MPKPQRGEIWQVDLGMAAKVRPSAVVSVPFADNEKALYAIVPHTTAIRGGRFEVALEIPVLERGVFDVQGLRALPASVFLRRLGVLNEVQINAITAASKVWLGITS